jgi:hypothetical protein
MGNYYDEQSNLGDNPPTINAQQRFLDAYQVLYDAMSQLVSIKLYILYKQWKENNQENNQDFFQCIEKGRKELTKLNNTMMKVTDCKNLVKMSELEFQQNLSKLEAQANKAVESVQEAKKSAIELIKKTHPEYVDLLEFLSNIRITDSH